MSVEQSGYCLGAATLRAVSAASGCFCFISVPNSAPKRALSALPRYREAVETAGGCPRRAC
ncbi:MAG: hypothetical protein LBD24_02310 [Spirochaetaceae bacterium]|nr:hypothetical protein [Spirochaetaceae bacterium]